MNLKIKVMILEVSLLFKVAVISKLVLVSAALVFAVVTLFRLKKRLK